MNYLINMLTMRRAWCLTVCFITVFDLTVQKSSPESPTYVAAVVEYSPQLYELGNHTDVLSKNAEQYVELIKKTADQLADIIVFPECGLAELKASTQDSSIIPDPQDKVNPCADPSTGVNEAVRTLSCAARKYQLYVVINIPEKANCVGSTQSTCTYYNTNVVFDRQGKIVARYRKFNLFGEPGYSTTEKPDMTVFVTDFGVKFGVFTCFDILFEKPAVTLVKEKGVTDIVYPTAWFSELPFLSAVQEQVAWAHAMDVNFLGSGYNAPGGGSTGSVIYAVKHGVLASIMATSPTTEVLVATVPKKTTQVKDLHSNSLGSSKTGSGILMLQDNLQPYTTLLLTEETTAHKLCSSELCCQFEVKMHISRNNGYQYRIAVFDGVRSFIHRTGGLQVCAVVFCANDSLTSCGAETDNSEAFSTTFEYIKIAGDFRLNNETLLPNTLLKGYDVMSADSFSFVSEEQPEANVINIKMETKANQSSLLTFGIHGRDFLKDGLPVTMFNPQGNGVNTVIVYSFGILVSTIVIVFFNRAVLLNRI